MEENLNLVAGANIELIRTGDEVSINNTYEYDDSGIEAEIQQLETSLQNYSLITETGNKVQIELNNTNYKMKVKLLDKNDNVINTSNEVDLPIEQLVTSITYDSTTKELVFTLKDGTQTRVPLSDLISGLVTEDDFNESQEEQNETIEALKEKVEVYKTIFNALPHIEDEDESMTLDDTANSVMEMTLKGNTSQYTTTGKNLINLTIGDSVTNRGVTFTKNSDGTISTSGTATDNIYQKIGEANVTNGTEYCLSGGVAGGSSSTWTLYTTGEGGTGYDSSGEGVPFIATATTTKTITIAIYTGTNASGLVFKPMLEVGSTKTDYEPYTGLIPSPNPDYQQVIHTINGDNKIQVRGKNLFDGELELGVLDGNTGQPVANTSYMRAKNFILVDELTEYVIKSLDIEVGLAVYEYKKDFTYNLTTNKVLSNEQAFTTERGTKYIKFRPRTANTDLTSRFMLNKGTTALNYDPYQSQTYPISLGTLELCKIGDYQDYFYKTDKWYLHKEIGKYTINITSITTIFGRTSTIITPSNKKDAILGSYCNKAKYTNRDGYGANKYYENGANFVLGGETNDTLEDMQSKFNSALLYYVINQTNTEITDTTLIEQLDNIQNAMSYQGQTNIFQENNNKPFIISASALKDLTNLESGE